MRITLALKQTNIQWLEDTLNRLSDPQSPDYGKYMSIPEIIRHVHGDSEGVEKVKEVLYSAGLTPQFTIGEGFAIVDASVKTVEQLFKAKYHEFRHKAHTELLVLRSLHSTIPESLVDYVDFVSGIHDFPSTIHRAKKHHDFFAATNGSVFGDTTPQTIDKAYNISGFTASNESNSQGIAGFLGQFFSPDDLKSFQKQYSIPSNPISKVVGTNKPTSPGMEASLDVQYITSTGRNVSTWFISVENEANGKQEDFMTWLLELVNNTDSPWVHSVSYGDYENSIDPAYMSRTEQEFMKLGISGRSLLFASGDDGTSCSLTKGKFNPMWPASSPHVTTVGGTESMTECWDHSGGGFSNLFNTPAYQKDAVENYLQTAKSLPSSKYFNNTGRGYPDLSVFSINYDITILGVPWPVDGTSCAAPTTAGIISLLNDIRLNKGQSTLGFLNPLLYKLQGEGFTDVTQVRSVDYTVCVNEW